MPSTLRRGCAAVAAAGLLAAALPATPASAEHDPWASSCRYDASTRTVTVHLATYHVVRLRIDDGRIEFADLTNFQNQGPCGSASTRSTDTIKVTEETPGESRLQLDQRGGRFAPGYTRESDGYSEIELRLGTLSQLWIHGRDVAERVTIGAAGLALTPDGDADLVGSRLQTIDVFAEDGNDVVSARGGYGTGSPWDAPPGGFLAAYGNDGDDRLYGAGGRDLLAGEWGNDLLLGGGGADDLDGGDHSDEIRGGAGNDYIRAGSWPDRIHAGRGDDVVEAHDETADEIDGGDGNDLVDVDSQDTTTNVESTR